MPTAIGSYLDSLLGSARAASKSEAATPSTTPSLADALAQNEREPSRTSPAATVALSEEAQAYLARAAADQSVPDKPLTAVAADARAWFDQQYKELKISSAMLDGQVAVDLTGQTRATLSAVASNAEKLFTKDEQAAAQIALQSRFDAALSPHVVIARHTGDYVGLYEAALTYLDQAGADERDTQIWQDQRKAVIKGLGVAKATPSEAPDTGDSNDPVRTLLDKTTDSGSLKSDGSTSSVAAKARAMLDDQINKARDKGTDLVFGESRRTGGKADFSEFDNRMLAAMVLDPDSIFSSVEVRAAKSELDQRTRLTMLNAITLASDSASGNLKLLQTYAGMSEEEKSVLGVTEAVTNRIVQNYQTLISIQNAFGTASAAGGTSFGISAYL